MKWLVDVIWSSVGRKTLMAVTGLSFILFLAVHFVGNMFLYVSPDSFNSYVSHLQALGFLVIVAELDLVGLAVIHVCTGLLLFWENLRARPVRYAVNRTAGGRTLSSRLMPYTGIYMLLFVVVHLVTVKYADLDGRTLYDVVDATFSHVGYLLYYALTMVVVALHVRHGVWSGFQTLGLNHVKYMPALERLGIAYALLLGVGFGLIPFYMFVG